MTEETVELLREPEGWNKDETIVQSWYTRQNDFTVGVILTKNGLYAGATKKHPEDPYDRKTAIQLVQQRAQKIVGFRKIYDAILRIPPDDRGY